MNIHMEEAHECGKDSFRQFLIDSPLEVNCFPLFDQTHKKVEILMAFAGTGQNSVQIFGRYMS